MRPWGLRSARGRCGLGAIELVRDRANEMLNTMSGNVREVAAVMVSTAERGMHQWLNVTLIVGVGPWSSASSSHCSPAWPSNTAPAPAL